jgi:SWI/SNF-related matrix-associated actin-dependent regulator of chromatin subfamily A3
LSFINILKGKTLTAIAVILTNFHDGSPLPVERAKKSHLKKVRD